MNIRRQGRRREEPTLELTPLIDVVFLLLIFFMITTSFARDEESSIPVDLAKASTGAASQEGSSVTISITNEGEVVVDSGEPITGDSLRERLKTLHGKDPDSQILLRGDQKASHGRILEILDLVKETGFNRVDLVVRSPAAEN